MTKGFAGFSIGSLTLGAGLCLARSAVAGPGDGTRLQYARSEGAARCPDQEVLKSAVHKRLGYDPFFPAARQTITVEVVDVAAGLRARMRLIDDQGMILGSRELSDRVENCAELVASLALAISIALDPSAALGEERAVDPATPSAPKPQTQEVEQEPSPAQKPTVAATPNRLAPTPLPPAPAPAREHSRPSGSEAARIPSPFAVRAGVFGALGGAPNPAFGLRAGGGFRRGSFAMSAELKDQFSASHDAAQGDRVAASLIAVTLAPCAVWRSLAACGLLEIGSFHAEGIGVNEPVATRTLFVQGGVRFEFSPVISGPLRLLLDLDALKSVTPLTLRLHNQDAWRSPFASGVAGAGLELRIP